MKILKTILMIVGVALIGYGLYHAFVPQELLELEGIAVKDEGGFNSQTIGMIGLGVVAFVAGAFLKNRR